MTKISLQKWHGAGNDFLVDVREMERDHEWDAQRARQICHRSFGVGADGLLVATLSTSSAPVKMTLFNADGTTAEMSGNGIRCLAAAVRRSTGSQFEALDVLTEAGLRRVALSMDGLRGEGNVDMGEVVVADDTPEGTLGVARVGNPHVVVLDQANWSNDRREALAAEYSSRVGGANVEFVSVRDPRRLTMTVFERGVGWTMACGTGSVAAAALARRAGLTGDDVTVVNPGGELRVTLSGTGASLAGPVEFVADVLWGEA